MNAVALPIVHIGRDGSVDFVHGGRSREEIRAAIIDLKERLLAAVTEHREMPVEHEFADGMYLRKLFIPRGTILVGKIHRKECLNIVAKGDISLLTEFGSRRVQAGFTGVSPAGIQKAGIAHEDTIFVNVFRTDELDLTKVEIEIACESHDLVERGALCQ